MNFQMFKLDLETAEEPEIKLPCSDSSATPSFPSQPEGKIGLPRANPRARDGVSREVPCSALKGETVPDSLPATPKSPPTRRALDLCQ